MVLSDIECPLMSVTLLLFLSLIYSFMSVVVQSHSIAQAAHTTVEPAQHRFYHSFLCSAFIPMSDP